MAVRAAEAGHGVAIGDLSLIAEDVAARKLHVPIDRPVLSGRGIFFVCPEATANQDAISTFRTWILSEAPALPRDQGTF